MAGEFFISSKNMKSMFRIFANKIWPKNQLRVLFGYYLIFLLVPTISMGQARTYTLLYSDNIKGGTAIFGNTLLQVINKDTVNTIKMNDNSVNGNSIYGNDNENMKNVDIDGSSGNGSV